MPESSFRRLFLNEWTAGEDRVASADDIRKCVTLDGPLEPQEGVLYTVGIDLGLKNDRTCCVVCHGERHADADDPVVGTKVVLDRLKGLAGVAAEACPAR